MSTIIGLVSTFRLPLQSAKLVGLFPVASSHNWVKDKKKTYEKALIQLNSDKVHIMV